MDRARNCDGNKLCSHSLESSQRCSAKYSTSDHCLRYLSAEILAQKIIMCGIYFVFLRHIGFLSVLSIYPFGNSVIFSLLVHIFT